MTAETVQQVTFDADGDTTAGVPRQATLSPSRAADFKTCPLLYRLRSIDRLPERPTVEQVRGTLVHAVLERLFDLPAAQRTPEAAGALVAPQWQRLLAQDPAIGEVLAAAPDDQSADQSTGRPDLDGFLAVARELLAGYFTVEDPRRLEPAERESLVHATVDGQLLIRGYIDRLDVSPDGDLRVVDYKTGGAPREAFESRALFQLKFYALVLWRTRKVVPRVLRLLYLKDAEVCDYTPDADELLRFERTVLALWRAICQATDSRDFRPKPSRLCDWCSYQAYCPAYGGTPPSFPTPSNDPVSC
ncbi:RecB family exonuclease [Solwaraspora sp. WMMB335]|uniref:RecB family exonuclease n=1 Tax=Solwaraspora sp. WMMB335 TaxID=3404118 RepID=UPI003B9324AA